MASSKVDICNLGLIRLGAPTISSLADSNNTARLCNQVYDPLRRKRLRSHPWRFAIKRQVLAEDTSTPAFGWDHQFPLPSDCLRTLDVDLSDQDFAIEGRFLLTDESAASLRYIADVQDEQNFDDVFCEVLGLDVALALARSITQSDSVVQEIRAELSEILKDARSFDAQEGTPGSYVADTWLDSRF
jgi:hypothetical protein